MVRGEIGALEAIFQQHFRHVTLIRLRGGMLTHLKTQPGLKNKILAGLPSEEFDAIRPLLCPVNLKARSVLQEAKRRIEHVDFIEAGIVSIRTLVSDSILETAMVGVQGAIGLSIALGWDKSPSQSMALVSGTVLRADVDDLRRVMLVHPLIREHMLRHAQAQMIHSAHTALCGMRHGLEPRLACWICLACDTLDRRVLPLTQVDLSTILGFRRPSIAEALVRFEVQGLIRRTRGVIEVQDRGSLGERACDCYHIIRHAYQAAAQLCRSD
ncbi:Crp/Fnr family transcriptional regulator [Bradyrhizobium sp. LMG 9283]|uniref:Crp/Fnr family transcriptional regulator n=1 Tax=Bradyrhizobium sp. LMG 9283 TaxID=592064 RepID=UPI00388E9E09